MPRLIQFLLDNPIVLLVVGVWIVGMIGNIAKAAKTARERAERAQRTAERREAPALPDRAPPREVRTAEEIAREMRRILGGDPEPEETVSSEAPPELPRPAPPPRPRPIRRIDVAEPEPTPVPVVPTTAARRLEIHVAPHVGEEIAHRAGPSSGRVGEHAPGAELGSLGGRAQHEVRARLRQNRYALVDLKRVIVMNEILGKPLALRSAREREL